MDELNPKTPARPKNPARHEQIFALLHQSERRKRPAERASSVAARYLDERTANVILNRALSSFKNPAQVPPEPSKTRKPTGFFTKRLLF
ncbi:MAG: hypothetical protein P8N14_15160 [Sulfitobacter sp.]|nr:hypothetical protein [Sulfitobacter sp.]